MSATLKVHPQAGSPVGDPVPCSPTGIFSLTLGSIGVVYGDIGTSPLYALKESLTAAGGARIQPEVVFGVVSLILWALIVIVTIKYVLLVMRADNKGEGGVLALMALLQRVMGRSVVFITLLGMAGAALFYGDAVITPAISVLSAIEGMKLVTPAFGPYILPLSLVIIVGLFAVQSRGTASVAAWFGPVMVVWFVAIAMGGVLQIVDNPRILAAISPLHGLSFLASHGEGGLVALGAVFLAVTGAEALYADMGHFGRWPIQLAWIAFVLPSLALNYLGQGALLLANPAALENPFFLLYPDWALLPMVILAMLATIIASQAVITGAYSLSHQAIQLGLLPSLKVRRTSATESGQVYLPRVNWVLLAAVISVVVIFKSSSRLGSAYGIAVSGTMLITIVMIFFVMWKRWRWRPAVAGLAIAPFLAVDLVFLTANMLKIAEGGWMPLAIGAALIVVMLTWRKGTSILAQQGRAGEIPLIEFIQMLQRSNPQRVRGTAVFLSADPGMTPRALLHNLKHNKVLHEQNVVVKVVTEDVPRLTNERRVLVERISDAFSRVHVHFGFMETPDVPHALAACRAQGLLIDPTETSFFLSHRALKSATRSEMTAWQDKLFIWLARQGHNASHYFRIPADRVVEVAVQIRV